MNKKYKITLLVTLTLFLATIFIPSYFKVVFYIKHISAFLFASIVVFLLLESQAKAFNEEATSEKQIKRNNTIKLVVLVIILTGVSVLQIRYISGRDTYIENITNIYDLYGNIVYQQDFMYDDIEVIDSTFDETTLTLEIVEHKTGKQRVYFYPIYAIKDQASYVNMRFTKLITIDITYDNQQRMEHITQITTEQIVNLDTDEVFVYTIKKEFVNNYDNDLFSQELLVYEGFESRSEEVESPDKVSNLELTENTRYYSEKDGEDIIVYYEDLETGTKELISKTEITVTSNQVDMLIQYFNDDSNTFESMLSQTLVIKEDSINTVRNYNIGGPTNIIGDEHIETDHWFWVIDKDYHDLPSVQYGNTESTDRYYKIESEDTMYIIPSSTVVVRFHKEENYIESTTYIKGHLDITEPDYHSVYNSNDIKTDKLFNEFVGSLNWNDQQRFIIYQKNPFFLPYYNID